MDWFDNNSLSDNPSKFQTMVLSRLDSQNAAQNEDLGVIINDTPLCSTDSKMVLGVNIDKKLNFN